MLDKNLVQQQLSAIYSSLASTYIHYDTKAKLDVFLTKKNTEKLNLFDWHLNFHELGNLDAANLHPHKASIIKATHQRIQFIYSLLDEDKITAITAYFMFNYVLTLALTYNIELENCKGILAQTVSNANPIKLISGWLNPDQETSSYLETELLKLINTSQSSLNEELKNLPIKERNNTDTKKSAAENSSTNTSSNENQSLSANNQATKQSFKIIFANLQHKFLTENENEKVNAAKIGEKVYTCFSSASKLNKKYTKTEISSPEKSNAIVPTTDVAQLMYASLSHTVGNAVKNMKDFAYLGKGKDQIAKNAKRSLQKPIQLLKEEKLNPTEFFSFLAYRVADGIYKLQKFNHEKNRSTDSGNHNSLMVEGVELLNTELKKTFSI